MITSPGLIATAFATAFNARDIDALAALYASDTVIVPDGTAVVPAAGLRDVLAGFMKLPGPMTMTLRHVVSNGDTALVVADWTMEQAQVSGSTSDVLRRGTDGGWRYLIDAPFGLKG